MEGISLPSPPTSLSDLLGDETSKVENMDEIPECLVCMDDIDETNATAFLPPPSLGAHDNNNWTWRFSPYCQSCIDTLLSRQFDDYVKQLESVTCEKEQTRLLARGPPINLHDCQAFKICQEVPHASSTLKDDSIVDNSTNTKANSSIMETKKNTIETNTDGGHREVYFLYYFSDSAIHSAKIQGSLEGEERANFIDEKRRLVAALNEERKKNI